MERRKLQKKKLGRGRGEEREKEKERDDTSLRTSLDYFKSSQVSLLSS